MTGQLLKVQDVMQKLNVSRRTVYYWIAEGIIKTVRIGGIHRFHPDDLQQLIDSGRTALKDKQKKILAIDDDILVRESIKLLLGRAGYGVVTASAGGEALDLILKSDFDLVLTDVRMPGMDGLQTLKEIRRVLQQAGKSPIPEVIMSAYEDQSARTESEKLGVKRFVDKPFQLEDFLRIIEQHIKK